MRGRAMGDKNGEENNEVGCEESKWQRKLFMLASACHQTLLSLCLPMYTCDPDVKPRFESIYKRSSRAFSLSAWPNKAYA